MTDTLGMELNASKEQEMIKVSNLYCGICNRPTDHRAEHDDEVGAGTAVYVTEEEEDYGYDEVHYCDDRFCPCDANQNRALAESRAYYAQDHEIERQREMAF